MPDPVLDMTCPMCGEPVSKDQPHCPGCGERLRHPGSQHLTIAEKLLVRKFRTQCGRLGGMWILLGVIGAVAGVLVCGLILIDWKHSSREYGIRAFLTLYVLLAITGIVMMTLGFYCRRRKEIGIYLSPVVCYLVLTGNLLMWNVWLLPVVLVFLVFLRQSHLVLGTARQMKRTGIPLDSHP